VIVVKSPEGHVTKPDSILVVEGEGMPIYKSPGQKGDLYVKLSFAMPTPEELKKPELRNALKTALPKPPALPSDAVGAEAAIARPFDADTQRERQREREKEARSQAYERDDEDGGGRGGPGGTQCRPM